MPRSSFTSTNAYACLLINCLQLSDRARWMRCCLRLQVRWMVMMPSCSGLAKGPQQMTAPDKQAITLHKPFNSNTPPPPPPTTYACVNASRGCLAAEQAGETTAAPPDALAPHTAPRAAELAVRRSMADTPWATCVVGGEGGGLMQHLL